MFLATVWIELKIVRPEDVLRACLFPLSQYACLKWFRQSVIITNFNMNTRTACNYEPASIAKLMYEGNLLWNFASGYAGTAWYSTVHKQNIKSNNGFERHVSPSEIESVFERWSSRKARQDRLLTWRSWLWQMLEWTTAVFYHWASFLRITVQLTHHADITTSQASWNWGLWLQAYFEG